MTSVLRVNHWIAASPDEIWRAYTTPEIFHQFFAPEGLHIPLESVVMELREGGRFEFDMIFDHSGEVSPNRGVIVDLDPPNGMVFHEPEFMGGEVQSIQQFKTDGAGTLISVTQEGLPDELVGNPEVIEAFRSTFRKLGRLLGVETQNRD